MLYRIEDLRNCSVLISTMLSQKFDDTPEGDQDFRQAGLNTT